MKRKVFYVRLFIAAVIVAALKIWVCANGLSCGGSALTMGYIMNESKAVEEVFSRLSPGEIYNLILVQMDVLARKRDGSVFMKYFGFADAEGSPEVPYNPETLRDHYANGDVIIMIEADLSFINTVRADLGLDAEDEGIVGGSRCLELYALACIKSNVHTYVIEQESQIDRWVHFLRWLGDMGAQALSYEEFAAAERKEI